MVMPDVKSPCNFFCPHSLGCAYAWNNPTQRYQLSPTMFLPPAELDGQSSAQPAALPPGIHAHDPPIQEVLYPPGSPPAAASQHRPDYGRTSMQRLIPPSPAAASLPQHVHMVPSQPRHVHVYVEHDYAASSAGDGSRWDSCPGAGEGSRWGSASGAPAGGGADALFAPGGRVHFSNEQMKVYTVPRSLQLEVREGSRAAHALHSCGPGPPW